MQNVGVFVTQYNSSLSSFVPNFRILKVSNGAKIRNRYNQVPHLTQDTNGKVTNSQKTPQTRAKRSALSQQVVAEKSLTEKKVFRQTKIVTGKAKTIYPLYTSNWGIKMLGLQARVKQFNPHLNI